MEQEISDVVGVEVSVLDKVDNDVYNGVISDNGREGKFIAQLTGYNASTGTAQHCMVLDIPAVSGEDRRHYGALVLARLKQQYNRSHLDFDDWCDGRHGYAD